MENVRELGMSVVYQAAEDYLKLLKKKAKITAEIANTANPTKFQTKKLDKINKSIKQLINDLRGTWCNELSNGLAVLLADELEKNPEAVAARIRKNTEDARKQELAKKHADDALYADLLMEQREQM